MTGRFAVFSRHLPAYIATFVAGVALSNAIPTFLAPVGSKPVGPLLQFVSAAKFAPLMEFNTATAFGVAGVLFLTCLAVSATMRQACAAGLGALFGGVKSSGGAAIAHAKTDTKLRDAVHDGLEQQLSQILKVMASYLAASNTQSDELSNIRDQLGTVTSVQQIEVIVELLAKSNAQSQKDAETLRSSLHDAQKQTIALRQKLAKAEKLASLDPLSSLPNRRSFQEFLEAAVAESHAEYTPLTVIMVDIDHFKRVNDKHGHATGDAVIRQFARVLANSVRSTDMVARYGGEEFVVVLKKTPVGSAVGVVERIQSNIKSAAWLDPKVGPDIGGLTASFGIAEILDAEAAASLIERADQRLYAAKRAGRNRAVWTSSGSS